MKSEKIRKRKVLIFAVLFALLAFVSINIGCASAAIYVPGDYARIQWAIDNATVGGETIIVNASGGPYYENVYVNKRLILRGICMPVVDAGGSGDAITLSADGITLVGFNVSSGGTGIRVISRNNIIANNTASNNYDGIWLSLGNNTITGNTFVNDGLHVYEAYLNTVEDNTVNGKPLVYLEDTSDIVVTDAGQVVLVNCSNITVENLNLSNTSIGIELWQTEDSYISNNNVSNNNDYGIYLYYSNNNSISGNNASYHRWDGIRLSKSRNNTITGNIASNNRDGFHLLSTSYYNTITGNTASNNRWNGIYIEGHYLPDFCSNNTITGNTASYNGWGILLDSSRNNTITRNIVSNNDWVGIQLSLSSNNNITGNTASYNSHGIKLFPYSYNNTITGNTASYNGWLGISLWSSSKNTITGNTASYNNDSGIYIEQSSNNTITGNTASYNKWSGIKLWSSSKNTITGNTASSNDWYGIYLSYGIRLRDSSDNKIYLNNFINNANVVSENSTNVWNQPKKIDYVYNGNACENYLGNYWSDYTGSDADTDGIGDTSYSIDSDEDNYPLMARIERYYIQEENQPTFTSFSPPSPVSDIEGATRTFNVTIDQPVNVSWLINGTEVQKSTSVTSASYTNTSAAVGTWNVSAIASNEYGTDMQVWMWNVTSLPYTHTDAGVTVDIELTESSEIEPLLPPGTDISKAIVINVNVTDDTPENATDDAYTDITINVGELDVETCKVYKEGSGFLLQVDDVATLPTVNGETKFSRDAANNTVIIRLYVGDPLLGVISSVIEGVFDTGKGIYPSITGTHTGTITPFYNLTASKLYTYPCAGTGGHTESIKLYENGTLIANGTWNGYLDEDWHNITLHNVTDGASYVTLLQDHNYNYTIRTGSYPQILHATSKEVTGGTITCSSFVDANGKTYTDWIPAIKFS